MRGATAALLPLLALCAAAGFLSSVVRVPLRARIQGATPPGMMGRVAALSKALAYAALLVAPFLGAALAGAASVGATFVAGSLLMLLVGAGALAMARHLRGPGPG